MTTLATLRAEIADDMDRGNLTTAIGDAIGRAITFYQYERFFFNETRGETLTTVTGQARYSSSDAAAIPEFIVLDGLVITVAGQNRPMCRIDPIAYELQVDSSASSGEPSEYTYYDQTIGIYPIPDAAYTIRMLGLIKKPAPAADDEANNVWMTHGYQLIRCRATADVYARKLRAYDDASVHKMAEKEELDRLRAETSQRISTGKFRATAF